MEYRQATRRDRDGIREVYEALSEEDLVKARLHPLTDATIDWLTRLRDVMYVAIEDEKIVGVARGIVDGDVVTYSSAAHPDYWNQGATKELMGLVFGEAKEKGATKVKFSMPEDSPASVSLAEHYTVSYEEIEPDTYLGELA